MHAKVLAKQRQLPFISFSSAPQFNKGLICKLIAFIFFVNKN
jgi:hypothetical protein